MTRHDAPAANIAVFWVTAMIVLFSCGSMSDGVQVKTAEATLAVLVVGVLILEVIGRRATPAPTCDVVPASTRDGQP